MNDAIGRLIPLHRVTMQIQFARTGQQCSVSAVRNRRLGRSAGGLLTERSIQLAQGIRHSAPATELSVGLFSSTQPNPTHTQPNPHTSNNNWPAVRK